MDKEINELIKELKYYIEQHDNEMVHITYDEIIKRLALRTNPELVKQLDEMVKDVSFWYA